MMDPCLPNSLDPAARAEGIRVNFPDIGFVNDAASQPIPRNQFATLCCSKGRRGILAHNLKPCLRVWGFINGFVVILHAMYDNIFEFDVNTFTGLTGVKLCDASFFKTLSFPPSLKERKGHSLLYRFLLFSDFLQRDRKNFCAILLFCAKFKNAWTNRIKSLCRAPNAASSGSLPR